jgi:hypothetical protein
MKNNISSYADLDREEIRIRKKLLKQEEEIRIQLKRLPEEVVIASVKKTFSGFFNGGFRDTGGRIIRSLISSFFEKKKEEGEEQEDGIRSMVGNLIRNFINKNTSKE